MLPFARCGRVCDRPSPHALLCLCVFLTQGCVAATLDVAYGGESGFRQAVEMAGVALGDLKLSKERDTLHALFEHVSIHPDTCAFGVSEVHSALVDLAAVKSIVAWEDLTAVRYCITASDGEERVVVGGPSCVGPEDSVTAAEPWVDWLAREAPRLGVSVRFVSDRSMEGTQLVRGFGGVAAVLTHAVTHLDALEKAAADMDDPDFDSDSDSFDM